MARPTWSPADIATATDPVTPPAKCTSTPADSNGLVTVWRTKGGRHRTKRERLAAAQKNAIATNRADIGVTLANTDAIDDALDRMHATVDAALDRQAAVARSVARERAHAKASSRRRQS